MSLKNIIMAATGGTGKNTYWISSVRRNIDSGSGYTAQDYFAGLALDSSENVYVVSSTIGGLTDSKDFSLVKYDKNGNILWQRRLGGSGQQLGWGVAVDSTNSVYITGNDTDAFIAKYDSSGTLLWQRSISGSGQESSRAIATDSSNNVYIVGDTSSPTLIGNSIDVLVVKYNSSGTLQFQRRIGRATYSSSGYAISAVSSILISGESQNDILHTAVSSSTGAPSSPRRLFGSSDSTATGIIEDSSDNHYYIVGSYYDPFSTRWSAIIARFSSGRALQWQRTLGDSVDSCFGRSITIDSTGVYVVGTKGTTKLFFAKYDKSGALQWQRTVYKSGLPNIYYPSIAVKNNNVYISCTFADNGYDASGFLMKIDYNATLSSNRSVGDYIYELSSLSDAAASLTATTSSVTSATAGLTGSTSTLTSSSLDTYQNSLTNIDETYWLSIIRDTFDIDLINAQTDAQGNIYSAGNIAGLVKYKPSGTLEWSRYDWFGGGTIRDFKRDSQGNLYTVGNYLESSYTTRISKYDSLGNIQWAREIYDPSFSMNYFIDSMAISSTDEIYVAGEEYSVSDEIRAGCIVKYNSSGTRLWNKRFVRTSTNIYVNSITVDSTGSCYVVGSLVPIGDAGALVDREIFILKLNSSGVTQWRKVLNGPVGSQDDSYSVCLDRHESNLIFVGSISGPSGASSNDIVVAKYSTGSGTLTWANRIGRSTNLTESAYTVSTDIFDNIYVSGYISGETDNNIDRDCVILKLKSDGTLLSSNRVLHTGAGEGIGKSFISSKSNNLYLIGGSNNIRGLLFKLPTSMDGAFIGSVYSSSSLGAFSSSSISIESVTVSSSSLSLSTWSTDSIDLLVGDSTRIDQSLSTSQSEGGPNKPTELITFQG